MAATRYKAIQWPGRSGLTDVGYQFYTSASPPVAIGTRTGAVPEIGSGTANYGALVTYPSTGFTGSLLWDTGAADPAGTLYWAEPVNPGADENLDVVVSSRSTYAGADTAGTTTLLTRIPGTVQPQTGDAYARIGANGSALTAIGDTRMANLDATISSRSTYTGTDTAGTTTLLGRIPGMVQPQTGDSYARIGASGAGLTALGDTRLANLDAAVSTRSTYAGGDTAGTTTLLARLTSGRATALDFLDVAISTRSTYAGADTAGTATLLTRIPGTVQPQTGDAYGRIGANGAGLTALGDARVANLDATVSSRSTYAGADTAGTTTLLGRIPGTVQPQTGDSYARIGVSGSGLTAIPMSTVASAVWSYIVEPAAGSAPAISAAQALALTFDAAPGGIIRGITAGGFTARVRNPGDSVDRVVMTVDENLNRTSVVFILP